MSARAEYCPKECYTCLTDTIIRIYDIHESHYCFAKYDDKKLLLSKPIDTWKDELVNDFEKPVFEQHPILGEIKDRLYELGANYAAMSGSGSCMFGIFEQEPEFDTQQEFPNTWNKTIRL